MIRNSIKNRNKTMPAVACRFAAVFLFFAILTVILFWPWVAHLSTVLPGPPEDNLQDFWNSWYAARGADYAHFFETNLIRFPEGALLNYHSFAYPQVFTVALLAKVFGADHPTLVALQNLTLLLSFPLAGTGAFFLVRHFTDHTAASLVGAFVFAVNPSHVMHIMHHAHVSQIEFIPFFVLAYLLALEKKSPRWLVAAIVFYALSVLSCWYYLFYLAYFIVFHAVYIRLKDRRPIEGWRLAAPLFCLAGVGLLLLPFIIPMVLQEANGIVYLPGSRYFVADVAAFFAFPPFHLLGWLGNPLYMRLWGNPWEATVYLGLANLALLAWLCRKGPKKCGSTTIYVLSGMAVFCLIAGGDTLHIAGADTAVPLPSNLFSRLPFFANVRTPSRAIVMVYLFLAIGVGYALTLLAQKKWGKWKAPVLIGIAAAIFIDFYPAHLEATDATCPRGLDIIRNDTENNFGILNLPKDYNVAEYAMFYTTCHGRPAVLSAVLRFVHPSIVDRLEEKNLTLQKRQLVDAHVKYIIWDEPAAWPKIGPSKAQYRMKYRPVFRSQRLTILRVY